VAGGRPARTAAAGRHPGPAPDAAATSANANAHIAADLHAVFERISANRAVPASWHRAIPVPIYKGKGDQADITSYRPLSVPTVACRVWRCLASGHVVPALTPCLCCGT
jgi:predicted membrane-bound mannosyltransferase